MTATEAQVAAAMEALGCREAIGLCTSVLHNGQRWTKRGCLTALSVADAVVAAGPEPATIAADAGQKALRQYADDLTSNESAEVWDRAEFVADARSYADDYPKWLS